LKKQRKLFREIFVVFQERNASIKNREMLQILCLDRYMLGSGHKTKNFTERRKTGYLPFCRKAQPIIR